MAYAIPVFIVGICMGIWGIYVLVESIHLQRRQHRENVQEFGKIIAKHLRRGSWDPVECKK